MGVVGETSRVGVLGVGRYGTAIVESHSKASSESSMVVDDGAESKRKTRASERKEKVDLLSISIGKSSYCLWESTYHFRIQPICVLLCGGNERRCASIRWGCP
jgi:hypothetical protein